MQIARGFLVTTVSRVKMTGSGFDLDKLRICDCEDEKSKNIATAKFMRSGLNEPRATPANDNDVKLENGRQNHRNK
jgi:hypothetical protein